MPSTHHIEGGIALDSGAFVHSEDEHMSSEPVSFASPDVREQNTSVDPKIETFPIVKSKHTSNLVGQSSELPSSSSSIRPAHYAYRGREASPTHVTAHEDPFPSDLATITTDLAASDGVEMDFGGLPADSGDAVGQAARHRAPDEETSGREVTPSDATPVFKEDEPRVLVNVPWSIGQRLLGMSLTGSLSGDGAAHSGHYESSDAPPPYCP
ncbi:hypothetical protein GY45DRAFT_134169 [Cubamyces sp. BRFM 1775]|nr:hypothetical protein GY45DRAFT_134169 [Cubamyces sp. BRFM 1775]